MHPSTTMRGVKRGLAFLLMLLFGAATASAGTIRGTVTDADTDEPLIGANVLVKGTTIGTATDVDGTYAFEVEPGTYTLVVRYVGYETLEETVTVGEEPLDARVGRAGGGQGAVPRAGGGGERGVGGDAVVGAAVVSSNCLASSMRRAWT